MKILLGSALICIIAFFCGWQKGLSFERNRHPSSVMKFNGLMDSITAYDVKTFDALSSGRMKTYIVIRGKLAISSDAKTFEISIKNQNEFADFIRGYFGIDDDQKINGIVPYSGLWLVIENQFGNRVLYSDQNNLVFSEML